MACGCKKRNQPQPQPVLPPVDITITMTEGNGQLTPEQNQLLNQISETVKNINLNDPNQ